MAWHHDAMGEIVNLRRVKKAKARTDAAIKAAENRSRTGRTKLERDAETRRDALATRTLDGARLIEPER